ncbi:MAG: methylenetetrahydrofolate--tRNA-(uracil(54)-C(5))-methyltransferase (FADH(2)-oxidizing) TrmFO, partial [Clostridia bacterium]|nr:methylenetetrahydrofolate--tRNA-(uracil(54)-C(5))-methyltransferase (FADH(2)-oxidizing) TrmFO [Clostridia bacterium]
HYGAETAIGALSAYVSNESIVNFQPMNVNFGIMADLGMRIKDKKQKAEAISKRSLEIIKNRIF